MTRASSLGSQSPWLGPAFAAGFPAAADLPTGKAVRVVLLFAPEMAPKPDQLAEGPIAPLMRSPLVVPGFKPLSRDEGHER
jgi:hypothetical protein